MSEAYEVVCKFNTPEAAEACFVSVEGEGWTAEIRKVNPDAHPE